MQTEIEAKWLDINKDKFRKILKESGATLVTSERSMTRKVFDFPDKQLYSIGGWVRVRNEGNIVTMSYKQLNNRTVTGTKEAMVIVNDFNAACSFLKSIGLESKSTQETRRESWKLGNNEIEIDTWPWIPSFVEIESSSEIELSKTAQLLGLDFKLALYGSVETAYQAIYDVTEAEINNWEEICFIDTPAWLLARKKDSI
jgi:adenylate cyclase class 2